MNILILGNGFDLAHGLPTRYTDFLTIVKSLFDETNGNNSNYFELCAKFKQNLNESGLFEEFKRLLNDNAWFDFLSKRFERGALVGINWIDFEAEIRRVVLHFEKAKEQNDDELVIGFNTAFQDEDDYMELLGIVAEKIRIQPDSSSEYLSELNPLGTIFSYQEYRSFSEYLFTQLRNLTRAFEIYCVCLIDKMNDDFIGDNKMIELDKQIRQCKTTISKYETELSTKRSQYNTNKPKVDALFKSVQEYEKSGMQHFRSVNVKGNSPRPEWVKLSSELNSLNGEIKRAFDMQQSYTKELSDLQAQYIEWRILREEKIDSVLSFNYTNTFLARYGIPGIKYCNIHGVAQFDEKNTNMILGIDETLQPQEADKNFAFVKLKKYFQRIFYKTGAEYRDWLKTIKDPTNVYILGHSLGATDHEVLREFFNLTNKNANGDPLVRITVFYHDEESKINAIERVIEIIGKNKLVDRVHGNNWSVRFLKQDDRQDGFILHEEPKNPISDI